jgi:hypothetical protein
MKTKKSSRAISKLVPARPAIPTAADSSDIKKNSETHRKIEGIEPPTAIQLFSASNELSMRKFQTGLIFERRNPSLDSLDMNCKRSLDVTRDGSAIGHAELGNYLVDVDPWRRRQAEFGLIHIVAPT